MTTHQSPFCVCMVAAVELVNGAAVTSPTRPVKLCVYALRIEDAGGDLAIADAPASAAQGASNTIRLTTSASQQRRVGVVTYFVPTPLFSFTVVTSSPAA